MVTLIMITGLSLESTQAVKTTREDPDANPISKTNLRGMPKSEVGETHDQSIPQSGDDINLTIVAQPDDSAPAPRGHVTFPAGGLGAGQTVITLGQNVDLSTFPHETGHVWLGELQAGVARPEAPESLHQDWATVRAWLGIAEKGCPDDSQHEQRARGWGHPCGRARRHHWRVRKGFSA